MHEILIFNEGDPKAEKAIYMLFARQLILFACQFTSDKMVAEEIVQDSFEKAFKNLTKFKEMEALKAFLYTTTRHACIDYLRKVERDNKYLSDYTNLIRDTEERDDALQREQEYSELVAFLKEVIEKQPPQRKLVLEYLYKYNKQPKEIALLMDIHVSGVYKHREEFIKLLKDVKGIEGKKWSYLLLRS